jgi:hypothetical protein
MENNIPSLSEEQKKKIKKLRLSAALRSAGIGIKFTGLILLADTLVVILNTFYVHNQIFAFIGGAISAIFAFRYFHLSLQKEYDRIREEVKKILEDK